MSHVNPLSGGGVQFVIQGALAPLKSPKEPSALLQTLLHAVRAGRRRGQGRRGACVQCGVRLARHFTKQGRFQSCEAQRHG